MPEKVSMIVLKKILVVVFSSCVGMIGGTVVMTPVIALLNYLATDGPYFPAPLIAWGFFALPIAVLLLPIQMLVMIYEAITKRALGKLLLLLGVISGLEAVIIWSEIWTSSQISFWMLIINYICGVFQASLVFGCHWIAYKLRWVN